MAATAENTLEQILHKLEMLVEKLGEKTTAKQRQEDNLKKYTERRDKSTPSDQSKIIDQIKSDVSDIADTARRSSKSTLESAERDRFTAIAKVYDKTWKLSNTFSSIKQLIKESGEKTEQHKAVAGFDVLSFNASKVLQKINTSYIRFNAELSSVFDAKWFSKGIDTSNVSKKLKHIQAWFDAKLPSLFDVSNMKDLFDFSVKNTRQTAVSKKLQHIQAWFDAKLPSLFDVSSMQSLFDFTPKNTRQTAVSKKLQHIQAWFDAKLPSLFDVSNMKDLFDFTLKNTRQTAVSKKLQHIQAWFDNINVESIFGKMQEVPKIKLPSLNFSKILKPLQNLFAISMPQLFKFNVSSKMLDGLKFDTSRALTPLKEIFSVHLPALFKFDIKRDWLNNLSFDFSKKLEPIKKLLTVQIPNAFNFKGIESWSKLTPSTKKFTVSSKKFNQAVSWFDDKVAKAFDLSAIKDWFDFTPKNTRKTYLSEKFKQTKAWFDENQSVFDVSTYLKEYSSKYRLLRNTTTKHMSSITANVDNFIAVAKKRTKESNLTVELKKFSSKLMNLKTSTALFFNKLTENISTGIDKLKADENSFVSKIQTRYKEYSEKFQKMLPTFKKKEADKLDTTAINKQSFAEKFKSSATGIILLGAGIALLVGALIKCKVVDAKSVTVFTGVVSLVGLAMWGLAQKSSEISKGAKAMAILGATFALVVLALKGLTTIKWDAVKGGLLAAGIAITGMTVLTKVVGEFVDNNKKAALFGGAAILGLTAVIGMLGTNLGKFANYDWKTISSNITVAGVAIAGFAVLAGVLGGLIASTGGVGALIAGAGLATLTGLAWVIGYTGEQLASFNKLNGDNLGTVGEGLKTLSTGLAAFFVSSGLTGALGVGAGAIQSVAKWFSLDMVSQIKKYESVDNVKIDAVGKSLTTLANGFKDFGAVDNTNQLSMGYNELKKLETLDIKLINSSLDSIASKLSNIKRASADMGDTTAAFKFKVEGISELNASIEQMSKNESSLLQQQLSILAESKDILSEIKYNTAGGSSGNIAASERTGSLTITRERSTTRESFFNNIKMMSTTLKDF